MQKLQETVDKLFNTNTNNYIFVYTPPKVGSTTLVTSLRVSLGKSYNIMHIHDDIMLNVLTGIKDVTINEIIAFLSGQGKSVYIIDVYRTPIERKMSEFFEKISPYHFNNTEANINNYSIKRVSDRFNHLFPHLALGEHYFDKYNVPEPIPFDFKKKYTVQHYNNIQYIKLRLCDSSNWATFLSEILKTDIILIQDYQTDTKEIGDLYKRFKTEYRLPSNYLDLITNCKYFNFYYSEEERNAYISIWGDKLCEQFKPYTDAEYQFYIRLYLENQYINDIQLEHYIDNGCFCKLCGSKRKEIYMSAKKGEKSFKKIIHHESVNEDMTNRGKKIIDVLSKNFKVNSKYVPNQFKINMKPK